jgi:hypothetical protein
MIAKRLRAAVVLSALLACAPMARGDAMLFSLDGVSESNRDRAAALGHAVSSDWLAQIELKTQVELGIYDVVFVSPGFGTAGYDALRRAVAANGSLSRYVAEGGVLVLNVAGNYGSQMDIAPLGVDFSRTLHNSETINLSNSPFITGTEYNGFQLTSADFDDWRNTDHGQLGGLPQHARSILNNSDGPSLVVYEVGEGTVLVGTLTVGWAEGGQARGRVQHNMIEYGAFVPEPATIGLLACGALLALRRRPG